MPGPNGSPEGASSRACYNCRRRRLRCDRSRPTCRKCWSTGVECLGYGTVLRWANAPAVRGRLVGQLAVTSSNPQPTSIELNRSSYSIGPSLLDPLLNDLDPKARHYVHHFTVKVCQDLVSFDQHDRNPFRLILPLAAKFNYLQAIIVATGAMHMAAALHGRQDREARSELVDALVAKDKAIRLLRSAVDCVTPADQAMVLAATVFLINLDLIDSGKGGWQAHIEAASTLMMSLNDPVHAPDQSLMPLLDAIAADCLTYRVLGSAISGVCLTSWDDDLADLLPVLRRAEPYSYHCCPPEILQILLSASSLCGHGAAGQARVERALSLLHQARSLDVANWVYSIRGLSAQDDLATRVSIALAHQATACLYILLAVPEAAPSPFAVDMLVQEVLRHLDAVPIDHVHLKGTIWPTFMVGAQTDDPAQRAWCIERMQAVWARNPWSCPWGYIRTAVQTMQDLWEARDREPAGAGRSNWLLELKRVRDKCLIV
ncbi:fungal-specific transcription factor domain-containing protein [Achaetomium macrosporum]|uniref:Fungal-specific transcription factor domain-containing protein n=1 Tax=Achaetomium macrosporum TaxID=79813 RepID=A0AAN7C6I4_9PEZI|nr:fungal-specific transcription factor domain-containing protein [Achaetomium macrosporum]